MKNNNKTITKQNRVKALEQGMKLKATQEPKRTRPARAKCRKTALQWYADRGALIEADEDASLNDRRLYAGEALARLHEQAYRRSRVTARYTAEARGGLQPGEEGFVRSESARRAFEEKFRALPSRTRAVVRLCVVEDEFVGRSRMERLRCGLDRLVDLYDAQKNAQNDTKGVDDCAIV